MKIIVKNVVTMLASLLFAGMAGAQVLDEFPRTRMESLTLAVYGKP